MGCATIEINLVWIKKWVSWSKDEEDETPPWRPLHTNIIMPHIYALINKKGSLNKFALLQEDPWQNESALFNKCVSIKDSVSLRKDTA